ncbi:TetR/AcrR family transcriptional regulator [Gordonia sp. PP30]|uniref:TetR/AcrR family transcriptional regulator n=1 Tax=unclassified Gordonia (in: high G+C Gram-positive bacteria) TaxID=2657482 RepID=UPI001FFF4806|nr:MULTISPECIES: TetR/AcrR family transcriptional regulator [unclassified Gordonia (in: high G+C Gram-positive bacteria)]UQE75291.1 TetR/AcrR family transcriptional regulator [Gordonia sp. PP30]
MNPGLEVPDATNKRRRGNTRRRLLDAAYEVYAEIGFGHTTVEKVVERAGFTRGAFYSNFDSLEELFLAMWSERSTAMIADIRAALDRLQNDGVVDLSAIVHGIIDALPLDARWWGITAEVNAHALRTPELRQTIALREAAIGDMLLPIAVDLLGSIGRTIPDAPAFIQALIAVYDGTAIQVLIEPENPVALARRQLLFEQVVRAYTVPDDDAARGE